MTRGEWHRRVPEPRRDIFNEVTLAIMDALVAGTIPWVQQWRVGGAIRNLSTGKPYQGINQWLLAARRARMGYASPWWLTFRQAHERGGAVRKGEKGTLVVFWKKREVPERDRLGEPIVKDGKPVMRIMPILKHYYVWNVEQVDRVEAPPVVAARPPNPVAAADAIWAGWKDAPTLRHGGESAYYAPKVDVVQLPDRARFASSEGYYHVLFHEATHATGHKSRLNRFRDDAPLPAFGSAVYAEEELVAELGASMLLGIAGMMPQVADAAAYIAGWLKALANDKRLVVVAAARAEKAVGWIMGSRQVET